MYLVLRDGLCNFGDVRNLEGLGVGVSQNEVHSVLSACLRKLPHILTCFPAAIFGDSSAQGMGRDFRVSLGARVPNALNAKI